MASVEEPGKARTENPPPATADGRTSDSLLTADWDSGAARRNAQARDLAQRIQRQMPERLEEYLKDVREASMQGNLVSLMGGWELVLEFGGPRGLSTRSQSLSAPFVDSPARQERLVQYQASDEELSNGIPELPARSLAADERIPNDTSDSTSPSDAQATSLPRRLPFRESASTGLEGVAGASSPIADSISEQASSPKTDNVADAPCSIDAWVHAAHSLADRDMENRTRWLVASRLLSAVDGDSESALEPIDGVAPAERRFWKNYTYAIVRYLGNPPSRRAGERASDAADSVREAMNALSEQADLEITEPRLCRRVQSFGNYEEFPSDEFRAGEAVVVYWEARHFASVESEDGYRTSMQAEFEILDSLGTRRHQFRQKFKDDLCRQRRTDYFNVVLFEWPKDLSPGEYTLKVIVTDTISQKTCERQRRIRIVAAGTSVPPRAAS